MGLVVVTGGARCGKSVVAENMAERCSGEVTVVAFGSADGDQEMAERIARHQADRPDGWALIEAKDSVEWTERVGHQVLLLDCLGTLLAMVMSEVATEMGGGDPASEPELSSRYAEECERRFAALVGWLVKRIDHTVVVTNEVGDGVVPAYASGRVFRDVLGRANRSLVERADRAYLVVAGRLIDLLELPTEGTWPWHERGCD